LEEISERQKPELLVSVEKFKS